MTVRKTHLPEDIVTSLKEITQPLCTFGVYFADPEIRPVFEKICKNTFNNSLKVVICNHKVQDIIKTIKQDDTVFQYHQTTHTGKNEIYTQLKSKHYWPNLKDTVSKIINKCDLCLQAKYERHPYRSEMQGPLLAKRPFEIIHIDIFTFKNTKFLTIIDLFSRFAQAYHVQDTNSIAILNKLRHFISSHNKPQNITCDQGPEFLNRVFIEFCKLQCINLHFVTPSNHSSNSPIERLHSTLIEKLRILQHQNPSESPKNIMITAITIYNQSIHSSTGFSPFFLLYGPYDKLAPIDIDATIHQAYNEKRFSTKFIIKNRQTAEKRIEKTNLAHTPESPNLRNQEAFLRKDQNNRNKARLPYQPVTILDNDKTKATFITPKGLVTTAPIKNLKRLRQNIPLQKSSNDLRPGLSREQH